MVRARDANPNPNPNPNPNRDQVIMELNGERWFVPVTDNNIESVTRREKASSDKGSVGAPVTLRLTLP